MCWLCRVRGAQFAELPDEEDEAVMDEDAAEAAPADDAAPARDARDAQPPAGDAR